MQSTEVGHLLVSATLRSRSSLISTSAGLIAHCFLADVIALCPNSKVRVMKLLSEDPSYNDAPREAIRRILEEVSLAKLATVYLIIQ